jgi:long-chain acyl-CoA synthetase
VLNLSAIATMNARRNPNGDAVVDAASGRRLNFRSLDERSSALAFGLTGLPQVSAGDRIAVLARNSAEYMEIFLAAAKSGLVVQPLNWRLAARELSRILKDASPTCLIASADLAATREDLQRLVDIPNWIGFRSGEESEYEELVAAGRQSPQRLRPGGPEDPFFILYTGGTTGFSKGAVHTHASAFACMLNQTFAERIQRSDVYMLLGQMFHIPVVLAMNYLFHGRPVVLANFDAEPVLGLIEQERVSAFLGITTMVNHLLAVPAFDHYDLRSLRLIQYGGGPMPEAVIREALSRFPCGLMQGYGQTEGGTMTFLDPEVHVAALAGTAPHRLRSCGREAQLTAVRVVEPGGTPVPMNGRAVGEIVVRSPANMAGYWGNRELTESTLRNGWMWTGDLASWDEDGFIFIVDRAKDMIVSGGENIYPAQVEAAIYTLPDVLEAAVVGAPDPVWGESGRAFVVTKAGRELSQQQVLDAVAGNLGSYAKPKQVEFVEALPKTAAGKVAKAELRARVAPD